MKHLGVLQFGAVVQTEDALLLAITFHEIDLILSPTRTLQVLEGLLVDREKAHRRPVLRGHVGNRRAVSKGHARDAVAKEFHELVDDPLFAKDFGNTEHQIGCGRTRSQASCEFHTDNFGCQHVKGLPKHIRFGLDSSDAPTQNSQSIDHGGVRIGAYEGIGIGNRASMIFALKYNLGKEFQVDLMHNSGVRWHHAEVRKSLLSPA